MNNLTKIAAVTLLLSATVAFDDTKTNVDQVRAATASIGYPSIVVPSTGR